MDSLNVRYQHNPLLTDTVGFFDVCIPLTNERVSTIPDSLKKYYNFSYFDYITPQPSPRQLTQSSSVFEKHQLRPQHSGSIPINKQSTDWITIILVVCLFIFAWIQKYYSKRFGQIFRAVAQTHYVNQLEREGNLFGERITLGLGFIYYAIGSIFIFQVFNQYLTIPPLWSNLNFTLLIFGCLFMYQMIKSLILYTLGIIFNTSDYARAYQLNILMFNHVTGTVLFPFTIMAFYWESPVFLNLGIIIASLLIFYKLIRGILTGLTNKYYNLFYLFLYLCTLEILPILLLYKVISKF